jgi:general secretion pathway protein A
MTLRLAIYAVILVGALWPSRAAANPEATETARLLAILLDSGRVVVGANQVLINDKETGEKGFTPESFEKQTIEVFERRSGVDLNNLAAAKVPDRAKPLLAELLDSSRQTVKAAQPVINKKGLGFKNFIPATFGTQTAGRFSAKTGVYLKQTASDTLLRNAKNKADDFESLILKQFADPAYPRQGEHVVSNLVDGGKALRLMLPLYYGDKCLMCHGEPRGELDPSAYRKEGGKVGDLGGAISVKLPLK